MSYIISQILVIISSIILCSTYFLKNRKIILLFSILSCCMYAGAYLLLGAYTGAVLNIVTIIASVWFYVLEAKGKRKNIISLVVIAVMFVVGTIFSYDSIVSLLATIALFSFVYSIWQEKLLVHKWLGVVTAVCWIIYNCFYHSIMGIIVNIVFLIIDLVAIVKYNINNQKS